MTYLKTTLGCMLAVIVCLAQSAAAQRNELAVTLRYAELSTEFRIEAFDLLSTPLDDVTELDDASGIGGEIRWTRSIFGIEQLRLGSAIGVNYYEESGGEFSLLEIAGDERLLLITPELQLSWRQPIGRRWFVEGGAAIGSVIANYQSDDITIAGFDVDDVDEWAIGFGVRPFLRAGYELDRFVLGAEVSYRWADLEFDDGDVEIDVDLEEFMAGVFVGIRF